MLNFDQDRTRDTLEAWHTDAPTVLAGVWKRLNSTVMTPQELQVTREYGTSFTTLQLLCDAWRSRLHLMQVESALP